MQRSDLELVRAAAGGDDAAFHELTDRHAQALFRSALSLTATRSDAEDLVQEALLGAFRGLARFDGRSSVKTWLTSILIRQAAKSWRKTRRDRQMRSIHVAGEGQDQQIDDPRLRIKSGAERSDQRIDLRAVLKTLQPEHREVIVMREYQGLSYEEIAQALGVPRGTVDSRIYRARLELRDRLRSYGIES